MELPKNLYKYESISLRSLLNLKRQVIYFGSPTNFNDPFDCALKAEIKEINLEEIEKLKQHLMSKEWPVHVKDQLNLESSEKVKEILTKAARLAAEKVFEGFIKDKGVSCFSEVSDELLMWAHYADKYQGFCLEFDTNIGEEIFSKAKKVKYVDTMPKLSALNIFIDGNRKEVLELYCTKSSVWGYEREWRCIHPEAQTSYKYPVEALTGIYFGPKIDPDMREILCLILYEKNPHIRFWQGKKNKFLFKVDFEEFPYPSTLNG